MKKQLITVMLLLFAFALGYLAKPVVTISGSLDVYRMPVSPTEYLILRPGDTIGIRVLKESGSEKGRMA